MKILIKKQSSLAELKRVGAVSVGTVFGLLYGGMGLIFGALVSFFAMLGFAFGSEVGTIGVFMGVGAIIFIPLFYGLFGFIFGCLSAWLYNIAAGWTGGIEMEFDVEMPMNKTQYEQPSN